jgi:hypothetical protein
MPKPSTPPEVAAYVRAARALQSKIRKYELGDEDDDGGKVWLGLTRARDRLEDKFYDLKREGFEDPQLEQLLGEVKAHVSRSKDVAFKARQARRERAIAELEERSRRANAAGLGTFARELELSRRGLPVRRTGHE